MILDPEVMELIRKHQATPRIPGTPLEDVPDPPADNPIAREWQTFKREIKRLLEGGEKGRFAVIKGDAVISVWDTLPDAIQAGQEKFGSELFMVQEVQPFLRWRR